MAAARPAQLRPNKIPSPAVAAVPQIASERAGSLKRFFHSLPTLPCRFFGRACAAPVRFETHGVVIAVALQRCELTFPINDAGSHGRPVVAFAVRFARDVLTVAMTDALFRQQLVSV